MIQGESRVCGGQMTYGDVQRRQTDWGDGRRDRGSATRASGPCSKHGTKKKWESGTRQRRKTRATYKKQKKNKPWSLRRVDEKKKDGHGGPEDRAKAQEVPLDLFDQDLPGGRRMSPKNRRNGWWGRVFITRLGMGRTPFGPRCHLR